MQLEKLGLRQLMQLSSRNKSKLILAATALLSVGTAVSAEELSEKEIAARLADRTSPLSALVEKIERTVTYGDASFLRGLINTKAVLERATSGVKGEDVEAVKKIFMDGTEKAWENNSPANDYAGTHFHFLRPRTLGNRGGLLFRSENDAGALNYYMLVLSEAKKTFEVRDIFVVGLNEFASDTLRRTYHHLVTSFIGKVDGKILSPIGADYVNHLQEIADMNRAMRAGKYSAALELWKTLPPKVQTERSVLMNRLDAAERVSPEERLAAMDSWAKSYPDEMGLPLKMADYFVARDQWNDAERVMRKVIALVGGDSRLEFQAGQISYRRKLHGESLAKSAGPAKEPAPQEGSAKVGN